MTRGSFGVTSGELSSVTGIWWAEVRNIAKHSVKQRAVPTRKGIWHKLSMMTRFRKTALSIL